MAGTKSHSERQAAKAGGRSRRAAAGIRLTFVAVVVAGLALLGGSHSPASAAGCVFMCWTPGPTTTTTTAPRPTTTTTAAPVVQLPPVTVPPLLAGEDPAGARRLLELANQERARAGLAALVSRDDVVAIALQHTKTMAATGGIFHNDAYFGSAVKARLDALARGENVGVSGSVDDIHARLMASTAHRANILDRRFTVAGMAVVRDASGQVYATQDFLQPRRAGAAPAAPPAPAAAPSTTQTTRKPVAQKPRSAPAPATTTTVATVRVTEPPAAPPAEVAAEIAAAAPAGPAHTVAVLARPDGPAGSGASGPLVAAGSALVGVAGVLARMARRRLLSASEHGASAPWPAGRLSAGGRCRRPGRRWLAPGHRA